MPQLFTSRASVLKASCLVLGLLLMLSGCAGISGMFGKEAPPTTPQELSAMQAKAAEAWNGRAYDRSMQLYGLIVAGQGVPREAKLQAMERYAKSALFLGKYAEALEGLDNWASMDGTVKSTWEWNRLVVQCWSATGRERQAEEHLAKLVQAKGSSFELSSRASLELAKRYAVRNLGSQATQMLRAQHRKAPDRAARAAYEADCARMLATLEPNSQANLLATVNDANRTSFPYSLIAFEDLRRATATNPAARSRLQALAEKLEQTSDLADRALPSRIMNQGLEAATSSPAQLPTAIEPQTPGLKPGVVGVALLLPQTGQLRALAAKVQAGAKAAQALAQAQGKQMDVRIINTDDPNFIDQLHALPPEFQLVGGPMHPSYFKNLPASGELSHRIFLTFIPELTDAEEGKQAWRFFWSPQDEVNTVLAMPLEAGVKRFAALYPENRMGERLATLYSATVTSHGGEMAFMQGYPTQDQPKWGDIVKTMVRAVPKGTDGKSFTARPDFEVLFLPDDLANSEHLIGELQFYDADSLIILGPAMWSEALAQAGKRPSFSPARFRFAFCPGTWWPETPSKAAAQLKASLAQDKQGDPDFWSALGFDFIRLASQLGDLPQDAPPSEISARLAQASGAMEWAMAPITWDSNGLARMNMFLLRPSVDGLAAVDKEGFAERLSAVRNKPAQ